MSCINRAAGQPRQKINLSSLNERLLRLSEQTGGFGFGIATERALFLAARAPEGPAEVQAQTQASEPRRRD